MQYYYNRINGVVGELPHRVTTSTGDTRTDPSTFTDEELEEWGYVLVDPMPEPAIDELVAFDAATLQWEIVKKPFEPQWQIVRKQRDDLLTATDWYVIRFLERGVEIPDSITTYRKALRDITLQENPFFIEWPSQSN